MTCIYPGSFDPITVGHVDIIRRASAIFDRVIVVLMNNIAKRSAFSADERLDMIKAATAEFNNVSVDEHDGLQVDYLKRTGVSVIIRGLRGVGDLEAEMQLAAINKSLYPKCETLFMQTSPELSYISSSAVREAASFGADISGMVPNEILPRVRERFAR